MRALFIENLENLENEYILEGASSHHLLNVVRLKIGEKIKLINGLGISQTATVSEIAKRYLKISLNEDRVFHQRKNNVSVAIGRLKKDAMDLSLKQLVEIGVNNIIIFDSKYSQSYDLKEERLNSLIVSSLEQSNNYFFPKVEFKSFNEVCLVKSNLKVNFTAATIQEQNLKLKPQDDLLIVIGPEGGLSEEEEVLLGNSGFVNCHLDTNILRASTAVSFCIGYCYGKMSINV